MYRGKNLFFIIGLVIVAVVVFVIALRAEAPATDTKIITFDNGTAVTVVIADDEAEREQGLSGVQSLNFDQGMLFVFDASSTYGFWMKDMLFPLDFVWIDENWKVVDITEHVSPDTYPQTFAPKAPVRYVLEISAGSVEKLGIKEGDIANLSN